MKLEENLFTFLSNGISGKDLILGGLFLIYKSSKEMYSKIEGEDEEKKIKSKSASLGGAIGQILLLDLVFSIDSIITAVGLVKEVWGNVCCCS